MYIGIMVTIVEEFIKKNPGYKRRDSLVALEDDEPMINAFVIPRPFEKVDGKWRQKFYGKSVVDMMLANELLPEVTKEQVDDMWKMVDDTLTRKYLDDES